MTSEPLLACEGLIMRFAGLIAVNDVSFSIDCGDVLSVIGPNGAGKSTLFNIVSGIYRPTAGRILFSGRDISGRPPHEIVRLGIARTFQSSRLFYDLSVLDNVVIGMHTRTKTGVLDALFRPKAAHRELAGAAELAGQLLRMVSPELYDQRLRLAAELPQADRRRVEIARALASQPKLLLLDEPSSGMDDRETEQLISDIRTILAQRPELALIIIEHDMRVVAELPKRVMVLDYGSKIAEDAFQTVRQIPHVQDAYLGKARRHA